MNKELKRILGEVRITTDLSQLQIAEELGMSPKVLSDMVNGRKSKDYTERTIKLIKEKYNIGEEADVQESGLPFYEVENFECGTPSGFNGALQSAEPNGYFEFPWIKPDGKTFCVKAHGNSMLNRDDPNHSISHGSYIALRRNEVSAIQWGEVYALATANGYIIKKLMPSEREGYVKCVSFNSDEFPPYDLNVNEIYDYAIVVGVATINLW